MRATWLQTPPRVLVVVAHPDDETIGAGILLARLPGAVVLHLTDGAPRTAGYLAAGFTGSRQEYAAARRRELEASMKLAGIGPERLYCLGLPDQETVAHLPDIAQHVAAYCRKFKADVLLTHAYEGGHPDHDVAAMACRAAFEELRREGGPVPELMEMALYHASLEGEPVIGEFLPVPPDSSDGEAKVIGWDLSPADLDIKQRMIESFGSQRDTLAPFLPPRRESFRPAPFYDFTKPHHLGILQYEKWGFPLTGKRWREIAGEAIPELGIELGLHLA
jgi:LmbE family N-acetylglucosaminyl deacetylase